MLLLRQSEGATKTPVALSLNALSPVWVIRRTPLKAETKGIGGYEVAGGRSPVTGGRKPYPI